MCVEHGCVAAPPCNSDKDCPVVCDTQAGHCVDCVVAADCPAGMSCAPWQQCVPAACSGQACLGPALFRCLVDDSGYAVGTPCDDKDVCTDDGCEPTKGCTSVPNSAPCSDGNACTDGDTCKDKTCAAGPAKVCDDGNVCTSDSCAPSKGCSYDPKSGSCESDGKPCTVEACDQGKCVASGKAKCDDGNVCTLDSCDPVAGTCKASPQNAGKFCGGEPTCSAAAKCDAAGACVTKPMDCGAKKCVSGSCELPCPGGSNCDCQANTDCDNGQCIDTPDGKKCAANCTDNCPAGYGCKQAEASEAAFYCVPLLLAVCAPCATNKDCQVQGATDTLCISYGDQGKFCGGACAKDEDCPSEDYGCLDVKDQGTGKVTKQCKVKTKPGTGADCSKQQEVCGQGEVCDAGKCAVQPVCACSAWAKASGLTTTCSANGEGTTCAAERTCGPNGLSACTAKVVKCSVKGWKPGSGKTCTANTDCVDGGEQCNGSQCAVLIGECKGPPACSDASMCGMIPPPTAEVCDSQDNDCDGATDEDFTWKNPVDGTDLKLGEACGVGPCTGGTVVCETNLKVVCNKAYKAKPEACDGIDNDCNGKTDDGVCK